MINVELLHNPYLLETQIKFNGQSPKINSQVEKFETQLLSNWIKYVPEIFYDEMNGYDFDLFFSGTEYDFQKLSQAFEIHGVTPEQVRLLMRNKLENAVVKSNQINEMLAWLRTEENRQLDFNAFYDINRELFEETFSCIVVGAMDGLKEGASFTLEGVNSVDEITGTNLTYVPIVFVIEEGSISQFRSELAEILERKDVEQKQLFFYISPMMDKEYVVRFICDLGVEEPQIISSINDGTVATYIQNYPMVTHVRDVILIVEHEIESIDVRLKEKKEQSAIRNAGIHEQISKLEHTIEEIKKADGHFVDLDNYSYGMEFVKYIEELEGKIRDWNSRRTKIVGETDIDKKAADFETKLSDEVDKFYEHVDGYYCYQKKKIEEDLRNNYLVQSLDKGFSPELDVLDFPNKITFKGIKRELVSLKEEQLEEKTDLRNLFKSSAEPKELVLVVFCTYAKFREKAVELIMPAVSNYIEQCQKNLQNYYIALAKAYHERLSQLHDSQVERKNYISSQLSEDERLLQADNDWLINLKDQMMKIERG